MPQTSVERGDDGPKGGRQGRDGRLESVLRANTGCKVEKLIALDIEVPLEVSAHLSFHLVDLLEAKHLLCDDAPRIVRVRFIANDLRRDHEGRDEESVPR
jgi:hypothetical protein